MKKFFKFVLSISAIAVSCVAAIYLAAQLGQKRVSLSEGISDYIDCSLHLGKH